MAWRSKLDALNKQTETTETTTTPTLTKHDIGTMDPADLVQLGGVFAGFLLPKGARASLPA